MLEIAKRNEILQMAEPDAAKHDSTAASHGVPEPKQ
jgi:hypothetical protein